MNLESLIGQTLDSKYSIEKELGRGGMGAVYLATHVGTERPVALKIIVPQFMERVEFVERFKREARAAGRLRHPNVVDVTDFGFANTSQGRVAYLVMEYLDGCTLGEILDEEKQLSLGWTLDILEQVCSAVHEAHLQGIIHRDLKPDNIWLEPNQRGGYTVKVLDFGIAKLEEPVAESTEKPLFNPSTAVPTQVLQQGETISELNNAETIIENHSATTANEAGTLIKNFADEKATKIMPGAEVFPEDETAIISDLSNRTQPSEKDSKGTRLISTADITDDELAKSSAANLTRVGAVLGTPLYMSPEQCRGEKLSPRSDIYSLAVIAYQMLSGKTPFEGNFTQVMDAHRESPPPPLNNKRIPKKVKKVLLSALAKDKNERPPTAEAFASKLRSHSEGVGILFRNALTIYAEHLPKFLLLALILAIPYFITTSVKVVFSLLMVFAVVEENSSWKAVEYLFSFIDFFVKMFYSTLLVGTTTWIVAQVLAAPLRPIELKSAFDELKKRWKSLLKTVSVSTLISLLGFTLCFFPGIFLSARYMLIAPSIMMEGLTGRAAFRRSKELVKRSFRTVLGTACLVYFIPTILALIMNFAIQGTIKGFVGDSQPSAVKEQSKTEEENLNVVVKTSGVEITDKNAATDKERRKKLDNRIAIGAGIFEILWMPIIFVISSFTSIITGLLYFKTRQAGGESMQDLLGRFEDTEHPQSKWQHRIRERLIQSGKISSTEKR